MSLASDKFPYAFDAIMHRRCHRYPSEQSITLVAQSITQASTPQWHTTAQCHSEGDILVEAFYSTSPTKGTKPGQSRSRLYQTRPRSSPSSFSHAQASRVITSSCRIRKRYRVPATFLPSKSDRHLSFDPFIPVTQSYPESQSECLIVCTSRSVHATRVECG